MPKATIPIYQDDDFERIAELRREVTIAERNAEANASPLRLGDEPASLTVQAAKDAFDAFVDAAAERAEMWVIKPIGHEEFRDLQLAHPPRKVTGPDGKETTHEDDEWAGVDTTSFPKALLLYVDPEDDEIRTIVEPKFETEAALRKRVKRLSAGEFDTIWITAFQANSGAISDPKSQRFSAVVRSIDATSK